MDAQLSIVINQDLPISRASIFPFLCRKFLETSFTCLLARVDPLRVISARKNQMDESYDEGRQNNSSINWSGDLLPKKAMPNGIWDSVNLKDGQPERSLLGWHLSEVAIQPGLRWLIDNSDSSSKWINDLAGKDDPCSSLTGHLRRIYSLLSKGVHAERLIDDEAAFDDASVNQHAQDCYMIVSVLAASTHASPFFSRSLPLSVVASHLFSIEKAFDND